MHSEHGRELPGFGLLWGIHIILGCGMLTPWNSYVTSMDFWTFVFNERIADAFAIANFTSSLLLLALQLRFLQGNLVPKSVTGFVAYILSLGFCVWAVLAMDTHALTWQAQQPYFAAAVVASVAVSGAACAVLQGALYSFSGQLHPSLVGGLMTGSALAGVLTCACRVASKLIFQGQSPEEALRSSSLVYMSSSLILVTIALLSLILLIRHPIVAHYRASRTTTAQTSINSDGVVINSDGVVINSDGVVINSDGFEAGKRGDAHVYVRRTVYNDEDDGGGDGGEGWQSEIERLVKKRDDNDSFSFRDGPATSASDSPPGLWYVVKRAGWWGFVGCGVYAVTIAVFPSLSIARTRSQYPDPNRWFGLLMTCVFNLGDLLGRFIAGRAPNSVSLGGVLILCVLRLGLIPLWVFLAASTSSFGQYHDIATYTSMVVLSTSNGFLASMSIMRAPCEFDHKSLKEKSSTFVIVAQTLGLVLGSLVAIPLTLLTDPSPTT